MKGHVIFIRLNKFAPQVYIGVSVCLFSSSETTQIGIKKMRRIIYIIECIPCSMPAFVLLTF